MHLSERIPFKTWANPQAHNQELKRANLYENDMVSTYRDLNRSGASQNKKTGVQEYPKDRWSLFLGTCPPAENHDMQEKIPGEVIFARTQAGPVFV